jgi:hypothetical protein
MAPGPVRWPWIASSVPSETFPAGVRFRGWMSEAEGFLCFRLLASLTWPPRPGPCRLPSLYRPSFCPVHGPAPVPLARRGPSCRPTGISDFLHPGKQPPRSCPRRQTPLRCRTVKGPVSQRPARPMYPVSRRPARPMHPVPRTPGPADAPRPPTSGPADAPRPPDARPGRRTPSPGRADLGGARGVLVRAGWAGSWQRIDGVSRLLPYSDLLALTSSSRRGEGVSDRGSWKRLRILPTGHVDAHVEPDIETGAVLIGPAWCLDR